MNKNYVHDRDALELIHTELPYMVLIRNYYENTNLLHTVEGLWCNERFGPQFLDEMACGREWKILSNSARWDCWEEPHYGSVFYFRIADDAALFKLTWG